MKEEPLIPAGVALTCAALIQATRKMNRGDKKSMNFWLRARIGAQGLTVAAMLGYSFVIGFGRFGSTDGANEQRERKSLEEEQERARFAARMKEVEEEHNLQEGVQRTVTGIPPLVSKPSPSPVSAPISSTAHLSWSEQWFGWKDVRTGRRRV
jgi:hypothetical protein